MTFTRRLLFLFCFIFLLAAVAPRLGPGPRAATQPAPVQSGEAQTAAQPASQAYTLPPDKLAKAIALSRIRNILGLANSLWGLAVLWLLLALGAAAGRDCCFLPFF